MSETLYPVAFEIKEGVREHALDAFRWFHELRGIPMNQWPNGEFFQISPVGTRPLHLQFRFDFRSQEMADAFAVFLKTIPDLPDDDFIGQIQAQIDAKKEQANE